MPVSKWDIPVHNISCERNKLFSLHLDWHCVVCKTVAQPNSFDSRKVVAIQFWHDVQECTIFFHLRDKLPTLGLRMCANNPWHWAFSFLFSFFLSLYGTHSLSFSFSTLTIPSRIINAQFIVNSSPSSALSIALQCLKQLHAILGEKSNYVNGV